MPTNTNLTLPAPVLKPNTYDQSAATSSAALRTNTAERGHNVFRPDVYRVSEGYLN